MGLFFKEKIKRQKPKAKNSGTFSIAKERKTETTFAVSLKYRNTFLAFDF
jgi:hypothetical protein